MSDRPGFLSTLVAGLVLAVLAVVMVAVVAGIAGGRARSRLTEVSGKSAKPLGGPSGVAVPECRPWTAGDSPEPFRRCWNGRSVAILMAIGNGELKPQHTDYKVLVDWQAETAFELTGKITESTCEPAVECLRLRYDLVEDFMTFSGLTSDKNSKR